MLTPPDELMGHQVSFPHAVVGSSDPSWRERYWVSFQDVDGGETVLTLGLGKYPNHDVMEGFACVAFDGRQHNVRLSRRLGADSHVLRVGPLSAEVLDPFRHLRFVLDDNDSGIAFEIDWTSAFTPFLEDRHIETSGPRITHDLIRYVQVGRAAGSLRVGSTDLDLAPATWWGERDHSWGVRPLPAAPGAPPSGRPDWRFLLFLPIQFADYGFHLYLFEDGEGHPTHRSCGFMAHDEGPGRERLARLTHDLSWEVGAATPTLVGGTVDVELIGGRRLRLDLEARPGRVFLRGGGYGGYEGWYQGHWKGELDLVHEVWDLADVDAQRARGAYSADHLVRVTADGETGHGIAEYMVLPGHHRYGHLRG